MAWRKAVCSSEGGGMRWLLWLVCCGAMVECGIRGNSNSLYMSEARHGLPTVMERCLRIIPGRYAHGQ